MSHHPEKRTDTTCKYAHLFDGDFDYSRWEGIGLSPGERKRKREADRKRSLDYKRKHG